MSDSSGLSSASSFSSFPTEESIVEEDSQAADDDAMSQGSRRTGIRQSIRTSAQTTSPRKKKSGDFKVTEIKAPLPGEEDMRRTSGQMTIFEYSRAVGKLADMFSRNEPLHPKYRNYPSSDMMLLSRLHINDRDIPIPLRVRRPVDKPSFVDSKIHELFNLRELALPGEILVAGIEKYIPPMEWRIDNQL